MSGHSKWHNIQVRKGKQDAKRAGIFTKLARAIAVAAREGGGDPETNFKLRIAIDKAKESSMPKDNIERAIAKGTGEGGGQVMFAASYEGKGPGGIDIIVEALTDNKNRTASEIKHIFSKNGGVVGAPGSVAWNFTQRGCIEISNTQFPISNKSPITNDQVILEIMDIDGIEDIEEVEGVLHIYTKPKDLMMVVKEIENKGFKIEKAELIMDPKNIVKLDEAAANQAMKLLEALDDYDDTGNVWTNME